MYTLLDGRWVPTFKTNYPRWMGVDLPRGLWRVCSYHRDAKLYRNGQKSHILIVRGCGPAALTLPQILKPQALGFRGWNLGVLPQIRNTEP